MAKNITVYLRSRPMIRKAFDEEVSRQDKNLSKIVIRACADGPSPQLKAALKKALLKEKI